MEHKHEWKHLGTVMSRYGGAASEVYVCVVKGCKADLKTTAAR